MMKQYLKTKSEYPDCILFYRLGDFYEMFFEDALIVSRELELTLTGKNCGASEKAPMCGVPHHSATVYIAKLIEKGYRVAICEQVEDPSKTKDIVKREVIRVVTPGTLIDEALLDEKSNNYLAVIYTKDTTSGFAVSDISTGEIFVTELDSAECVMDELARYSPKEILVSKEASAIFGDSVEERFHMEADNCREDMFERDDIDDKILSQFKKHSFAELGLSDKPCAIKAVGAMLCYLEHTQKQSLDYIDTLTIYTSGDYMDLDFATRRNLEICETMRDRAKKGSLLGVIDKTKTSMGARLLRQWAQKPLINANGINERLLAVEDLVNHPMTKDDLGEALSKTYDISRIISRLSLGTATPKDLLALKETASALPEVEYVLSSLQSLTIKKLLKDFDTLADIRELIENSISDDAPATLKDGGIIKRGYSEEIDTLRNAKNKGSGWLTELEAQEKERTGIPTLKVGYNRVFGYYIEVSKSYMNDVPDTYIRKQTLSGGERYITEELKKIENTILGASERLIALEAHEYDNIRKQVAAQTDRLKKVAQILSLSDCYYSLAQTAYKNNYVMPQINTHGLIEITDGRHPVVETMTKNSIFVPNDTYLDTDENRTLIITGPNMAGKSTYMRQVAIITLMAQIGSFVPAKKANIGIVDRIFTRVGASDDIASGQSTFMLEMNEVSHILKNATKNSLIILDEIGRGTSTYDGMSIAWAVAEYIHNKKKIGAKTLFATHYHELTELEERLEGVKNYRVAVKKRGDDITFLRKIVRGGADESYGIEVAALAGIPNEVILNAKKILKGILEEKPQSEKKISVQDEIPDQLDFGLNTANEIAQELKTLDVTTYTPIEALNKLYELTNKAKNM